MSDQASHSYADYEGTSSKPTRPYQSMWMGRWVGTSGNAGITSHVDSGLSLRLEAIEDAAVNTKKLHLPLKDELDPSSQRLTLSLTNFPETDHNYASASKFPSLPAGSSTGEHLGQMNNSKVVDNSLALAVPFSDRFTKFIQGKPSTAEKGKMSLFMGRYKSKEHFSSTNLTILENTRSSVFLCEEKIDSNPSKPGRSMFLHNPSSSKPNLPLFMGQQFQNIQNMSAAGGFSGQGRFQEEIRTETSFQCYNKVKTKKIFTNSDSTDELDDQDGFSLARRSFPFRDAMVSTHQPKVDMIEKMLKFSGGDLARDKGGVRLQLLSSSSDSDEKCNKDGENNPEPQLKNESSAETDTMDMDSLREQNIFPGVNSSPKNKDNFLDETEECTFSSIPKKDKEIRFLPVVSLDKPETSTSSAQNPQPSTHLLSKPDPPNPPRSISRPHMIDPGSRWLKRLKLISKSDSFGIGTISEEPPLLREIIKRKNTIKMKLDEKGARKDETVNEKSNVGQSQGQERERENLLSHDWIQRWCRNKAAADIKGKIEKEVIREPKKFKLEIEEELRNKQFPSIAAMALMGKTMAGFRTCELKRKGSSVVWNTKKF